MWDPCTIGLAVSADSFLFWLADTTLSVAASPEVVAGVAVLGGLTTRRQTPLFGPVGDAGEYCVGNIWREGGIACEPRGTPGHFSTWEEGAAIGGGPCVTPERGAADTARCCASCDVEPETASLPGRSRRDDLIFSDRVSTISSIFNLQFSSIFLK